MFTRKNKLKKWAENNGYSFKIEKNQDSSIQCWSFGNNNITISGVRHGRSFGVNERSYSGSSFEYGTFREDRIKVDTKIIYPKQGFYFYFFRGGLLSIKQIENLLDEYIKNGKIDYKKYFTLQQKLGLFIISLLLVFIIFGFIKVLFF